MRGDFLFSCWHRVSRNLMNRRMEHVRVSGESYWGDPGRCILD